MREFRIKLHVKTDISFQVQFNAEFMSQVLDFPWIA